MMSLRAIAMKINIATFFAMPPFVTKMATLSDIVCVNQGGLRSLPARGISSEVGGPCSFSQSSRKAPRVSARAPAPMIGFDTSIWAQSSINS